MLKNKGALVFVVCIMLLSIIVMTFYIAQDKTELPAITDENKEFYTEIIMFIREQNTGTLKLFEIVVVALVTGLSNTITSWVTWNAAIKSKEEEL